METPSHVIPSQVDELRASGRTLFCSDMDDERTPLCSPLKRRLGGGGA